MVTHRTGQVQKHHGLLPLSTTGDAACGRTQILDQSVCKESKNDAEPYHCDPQPGDHNHQCQDAYQITSLPKTPIPCTVERKTIR